VLPELAGGGATPAARASVAALAKRWAPGDLADELGRGQRPERRLAERLRREPPSELGDLALEPMDGLGALAQAAQLVACDRTRHRLLGPRQAPTDPRAPLLRNSAPPGRCSSGQIV